MGIKSWIKGRFNIETKSTNPYSDESFLNQSSSLHYAGVDVNYNTAMRHQDVYTCVRIKAEALGQLPINLAIGYTASMFAINITTKQLSPCMVKIFLTKTIKLNRFFMLKAYRTEAALLTCQLNTSFSRDK